VGIIGAGRRPLDRAATTVEPVLVEAKGKPAPVEAFRLLDVDPEAEGFSRRLDAPLVGREAELRLLREAFERAVRERRCQLFTLLGPAGVGKSRLAGELLNGLDATVVSGRCLDYGEGITYWPVVSVLKGLGPRAEGTLTRLVEGGAAQSELFWDVRVLLEQVAAERPLVAVFDDIHWGEPTFLDLLDHIADLSRDAPILLLCLARPDLLERRPGWGGGKLNSSTMLLEPLSTEECETLIDRSGDRLDPETRSRILAAAGGNPLFVEEMLALARESGDVHVPTTVHALLQARLDQLARDERSVIERGAVEGEIFHRGAVRELAPVADLEAELDGLVRKELIRPAPSTFANDHAFRFRHLLIRDTAYDALPKEIRAELHERFAEWLAAHGGELIELDEIVGHHLGRASAYRRELGRPDRELDVRAAVRLAAAGSKAASRSDIPAADNLLARALELFPAEHPARLTAALERLTVLDDLGTSDDRTRLIAELEGSSDPLARTHGKIARLLDRLRRSPQGVLDEAFQTVGEARELFEAAGDELGLARAWYLAFWGYWMQSRGTPALDALDHIGVHAERAGAQTISVWVSLMLLGPLIYAPLTPEEIEERLGPLRASGSLVAQHTVLRAEAKLLMYRGEFDEALELHARATEIIERLGMTVLVVISPQAEADVLSRAGRLEESLSLLRRLSVELDELGETAWRSTNFVWTAEVLYDLGELEEAERCALEGEEMGADEDFVNFAMGRAVRARVAADRGDNDEAAGLAEQALHYASLCDFPEVHGKVDLAVAHVHEAAGRNGEARAVLERALERFDHFGNVVEADRTRAQLVALPA
jgi:tetratricopeptide (TPR) repeat protein